MNRLILKWTDLNNSLLLFRLQGINGLYKEIKSFIADAFCKSFGVIKTGMNFANHLEEVHAHNWAELMNQVHILQHFV